MGAIGRAIGYIKPKNGRPVKPKNRRPVGGLSAGKTGRSIVRDIQPAIDGGLSNLSKPGLLICREEDEAAERYIEYLETFKDSYNAYARQIGFPSEIDISIAVKLIQDPDFRYFGSGFPVASDLFRTDCDTGLLHSGQILTILDCLYARYVGDRGHLNIIGVTQCGKTSTFSGMFYMSPAIGYLRTGGSSGGMRSKPIIIVVNKNDLEEQVIEEFHFFYQIHGSLSLVDTKTGESIQIARYFHDVLKDRVPFADTYDPANSVLKTSVASGKSELKSLWGVAEESECIDALDLYIDESHYGTEKLSVLHRMIGDFLKSEGLIEGTNSD